MRGPTRPHHLCLCFLSSMRPDTICIRLSRGQGVPVHRVWSRVSSCARRRATSVQREAENGLINIIRRRQPPRRASRAWLRARPPLPPCSRLRGRWWPLQALTQVLTQAQPPMAGGGREDTKSILQRAGFPSLPSAESTSSPSSPRGSNRSARPEPWPPSTPREAASAPLPALPSAESTSSPSSPRGSNRSARPEPWPPSTPREAARCSLVPQLPPPPPPPPPAQPPQRRPRPPSPPPRAAPRVAAPQGLGRGGAGARRRGARRRGLRSLRRAAYSAAAWVNSCSEVEPAPAGRSRPVASSPNRSTSHVDSLSKALGTCTRRRGRRLARGAEGPRRRRAAPRSCPCPRSRRGGRGSPGCAGPSGCRSPT